MSEYPTDEQLIASIPEGFNLDADPTIDDLAHFLPYHQRVALHYRQYAQARRAKKHAKLTAKVQKRLTKNLKRTL